MGKIQFNLFIFEVAVKQEQEEEKLVFTSE